MSDNYGEDKPWHLTQEPDEEPSYEDLEDRIEELEAKLAKAVEALRFYGGVMPVSFLPAQDGGGKARTTLAELTGGKDDTIGKVSRDD